jgi:hypothetical protein
MGEKGMTSRLNNTAKQAIQTAVVRRDDMGNTVMKNGGYLA